MLTNNFVKRHIGPTSEEVQKMLNIIGVQSLDEMLNDILPDKIRLTKPLNLPEGMNEYEYLQHLKGIGKKNKMF